MIIPKLFIVWAQRLFLYGSVVAIGVFLIVVAAGSYRPRVPVVADADARKIDVSSKTAVLNVAALPALVGDVALLPVAKDASGSRKAAPNLTEQFAASLARDVVDKNPNGPGAEGASRGLEAPDIGALIESFLNQEPSIVNTGAHISTPKFVVIENASFAALSVYLQDFTLAINIWIDDVDPLDASSDFKKVFREMAQRQVRAINALTDIAVPSSFAGLHRRALSVLATNKTFFNQLQDYSDDPLRAVLTIRQFAASKADLITVRQEVLVAAQRAMKLAVRT